MFNKRKEFNKASHHYRVRGNSASEYSSVNYIGSDDINSVGVIIDEFLNKNYVCSVIKNQPAYSKFLNKYMAIISSYDSVLELDMCTYDRFKDKIQLNLSRNTCNSVLKFSPYNGTRILVNYVKSGCEYETSSSNQGLYEVNEIKGIKTLYISYDNCLDKELFKRIILDFYGDFSVEPEVRFLPGTEVTLNLGNKFLKLDYRAYELALALVIEHKHQLENKEKQMVLQMKMEA